MQLLAIAVWNAAGDRRTITLVPGQLNVITGDSQTGKSALIPIIRFCLGSDELKVPRGPISDTVRWYGLLTRIGETQVFLGRPAPPPRQATSTAAMLEIGVDEFPAFDALRQTTNVDGLREYLGRAIGIEENLHVPAAHHTREPLAASFVHSLYYCFQRQDEIANQRLLFHNQAEEWVPQAIRDTLPYFLGASGPRELDLRAQLREAAVELRRREGELRLADADRASGLDRANALVSEAAEVGLAPSAGDVSDLAAVVGTLQVARDQPLAEVGDGAEIVGAEWSRLQAERTELSDELRRLREQSELLASFARDEDGYAGELGEQAARLQSLELTHAGAEPPACPACDRPLDAEAPSAADLRASLEALDARLANVERDRPRLAATRLELARRESELLGRLNDNTAAREALARQEKALAAGRERLNLQSYVQGRIDQFLQAVAAAEPARLDRLRGDVERLRTRVAELEEQLDPAVQRDRATSVLVAIGRDMTAWAQELGLEHADQGVRIDLGRLTVVADTPQGPIHMDTSIGSGKNWVGYHLVAYLALQKFFATQGRPVPRFLVLDQPTQAFFPRDRVAGGDLDELSDTDRRSARELYELTQKVVKALDGRLQILALDHADFDVEWFQTAVTERWRDGQALIPRAWLDTE